MKDTSVLEERRQAVEDLIEMMRPAIQADGGDVALLALDVDNGIVEIQLQGSCSSCAISSVTLNAGIERIIKGRLPWVTEVKGDVDQNIEFEQSVTLGRGGYIPRGKY